MRGLGVALVGVVLIAGTSVAAAGVPIPCTGERLVKVVDVPLLRGVTIKANRDLTDKRLDLGYKFIGCFGGGEWVGHVGHDTRYLPLNDETLTALLKAAGLKQLPPTPSRFQYWETMKVPLLWAGILGLGIFFGGRNVKNGGAATRPSAPPAAAAPGPAPLGADARADAAIAARLAELDAEKSSAAARPATPRRPSVVVAQRASFGRRG